VHVHVVSVSGSEENIVFIVGLPSNRSWPLAVGCMGYGGVCGLCRRRRLMRHIVCPVLAILRIGVVVFV
jgi:hypothetical protein